MKITLKYDGQWAAVFEVDLKRAAPACLESLDFFGDPITRDDESDIFTVKAFIQFWGPTLINISQRKNLTGIIREMGETEGCIPLDGKKGITLISCDNWSFDHYDFEVGP